MWSRFRLRSPFNSSSVEEPKLLWAQAKIWRMGKNRTLCPQILSQQPDTVSAAPEIHWKPVFIRMTDFRGCLSPTDSVLVELSLKWKFHTLPPENWARSKAGQAKAALPTAFILWPWAAQAPAVLSHLFTLSKAISTRLSRATSCASPPVSPGLSTTLALYLCHYLTSVGL